MASVKDIAPDWLSFHRASEWGAVWKRRPVAERLADPETYIHHGAGGRFGTDHFKAMRDLQTWYHSPSKNYSMIAYDAMVHLNTNDNTVAIMGAREGWLSAATRDRNEQGEAICLFGYFHPGSRLSEAPTERELEALAFAVAWFIENGWSALGTKVMGHRDNPAHPGATSCPGDYLYPHIPSIQIRAQQILIQANQTEEETDMVTLPKPRRAYDSRSVKPFRAGETRNITVGGTNLKEVFVNVTVVGQDGTSGYVSLNDAPNPTTSVVNYSGEDRLEGNGVPVAVTNGSIDVTNVVGKAHVILDVFAEK